MLAVLLVAGVGSFVDWRKEVAFVAVKLKQMEKNVVSKINTFMFERSRFCAMEHSRRSTRTTST